MKLQTSCLGHICNLTIYGIYIYIYIKIYVFLDRYYQTLNPHRKPSGLSTSYPADALYNEEATEACQLGLDEDRQAQTHLERDHPGAPASSRTRAVRL